MNSPDTVGTLDSGTGVCEKINSQKRTQNKSEDEL